LEKLRKYLEEAAQQRGGGGFGAQMRPKVRLRVRVYRAATDTWKTIKEA